MKTVIKLTDVITLQESTDGYTLWAEKPFPYILTDAPFARIRSEEGYAKQLIDMLTAYKTPDNEAALSQIIERMTEEIDKEGAQDA